MCQARLLIHPKLMVAMCSVGARDSESAGALHLPTEVKEAPGTQAPSPRGTPCPQTTMYQSDGPPPPLLYARRAIQREPATLHTGTVRKRHVPLSFPSTTAAIIHQERKLDRAHARGGASLLYGRVGGGRGAKPPSCIDSHTLSSITPQPTCGSKI